MIDRITAEAASERMRELAKKGLKDEIAEGVGRLRASLGKIQPRTVSILEYRRVRDEMLKLALKIEELENL